MHMRSFCDKIQQVLAVHQLRAVPAAVPWSIAREHSEQQ
jgi:hypothetical protein